MGSQPKALDILHLVEYQKFIPPFIDLLNQELEVGRHHFYFLHNGHKYVPQGVVKVSCNAKPKNIFRFTFDLFIEAFRAEKIILHGLFSSRLLFALVLQPWLWRRCYWIIWGGDLYTYALDARTWKWRLKEVFRKILIANIGHLVTYISGDVALARQWYGAKGVHHECIMYPSNTYQPLPAINKPHQGLNILIGNSADPSNNHAEIIKKLKILGGKINKVIAPLSYGEKEYAREVTALGIKEFGHDFVALEEFMGYDDYLEILAEVDVAVFNHQRQQGMGNIISLLGMGKTVAIRSDISTWELFLEIGVVLRDTLDLDLSPLPIEVLTNNQRIIKEKFSIQRLVYQLKSILENS
ncbi:TDP-N-acetylfucosamine:lipid II N-acetylfucosaminyltransferase [Chromobacterium violaceum]|uniref:TDP-N-acetylfucosamine:lipid II N-acetylfucosaminyltransferase n=1 Tax=Chromobacterium violaceum TaxID=536 RepID=UPI0035A6DC35